MQYVGQTGRKLKERFREHVYKIKNGRRFNSFIYRHFKLDGHDLTNLEVQIVECLTFDNTISSNFKTKARCTSEFNWIKKLQTPYPLGLNDNILHQGNISNDPSIDIFSLFDIRKRKSRSHGRRQNGNIKRKRRKSFTLQNCLHCLNTGGRHLLLSSISSLSLSQLRLLDQEADKIILRTDKFYLCAIIIQKYAKHYLHPRIQSPEEVKRYFLKIAFLNKGIDFIDINSILKDKNVVKHIPPYFENKETPAICYSYKKPHRNFFLNYGKAVSAFPSSVND